MDISEHGDESMSFMEPDHPSGAIGLVVTGLVVTGCRASGLGAVERMMGLCSWLMTPLSNRVGS
jgi:hypothetical protein